MQKRHIKRESFRSFSTPLEVNDWLTENYTREQLEEFDGLRGDENPIGDYKGAVYKYINECTRFIYKGAIPIPEAAYIQDKLLKMEIPENIRVSRFVDLKEFVMLIRETAFSKSMLYKSFMSTTLLKDYCRIDDIRRERHVFPISIYVPKGTPGMYISDNEPEFPEYEILFPHGLHIERISIKEYLITP